MAVVSIDGVVVAPAQAVVSVFDRGLLYGDGCFEVLRTWDGVAVDLEAHLDRLLDTAAFLQLRGVERAALVAQLAQTLAAAGEPDQRIRIVLTRGPGALAARTEELGPGRVIMIAEPLGEPLGEQLGDPLGEPPAGLALAVVDWPVAPHRGPGRKTLAYLDHLLARDLARAAGADEAVRLDPAGEVVEGATSNLFVVAPTGEVATPAVEAGALPGIVRARVLALCEQLGVSARVGAVELADLRAAREVFITSSVRGVVAVTRVDGTARARGPITEQIARAYVTAMRARASAHRAGRAGREG